MGKYRLTAVLDYVRQRNHLRLSEAVYTLRRPRRKLSYRLRSLIYPYSSETSEISNMLREYIDTPSSELMTKKFEGDHWGLTDILRAADRRIGRRRLAELAEVVSNPAAQKNLKQRINTYKEKQRKAAEADGF